MAHADYECCAICDCKIAYSQDAGAKEMLCAHCANELGLRGIRASKPLHLLAWIEAADLGVLVETLTGLGYRQCYYGNPVDETVQRRTGDKKFGGRK